MNEMLLVFNSEHGKNSIGRFPNSIELDFEIVLFLAGISEFAIHNCSFYFSSIAILHENRDEYMPVATQSIHSQQSGKTIMKRIEFNRP